MKAVMALLILATIAQVRGECFATSCFTSSDCAVDAEDFACRCVSFHCGLIEGKCGGGCLTDEQCAKWAGDDNTCVCGSLFDCETLEERSRPGYETYTKFMAALQGDKLKQKVEALYQESLAKNAQN